MYVWFVKTPANLARKCEGAKGPTPISENEQVLEQRLEPKGRGVMKLIDSPEPGLRPFRVRARITFLNDDCMDVPFTVCGIDEDDVRRQVTPDYIMNNFRDDSGTSVRNVTVLKVYAAAVQAST